MLAFAAMMTGQDERATVAINQMLAEQEPAEHLPIARAFRHFARGVAFAAKKQVAEARAE